jgi:sulfoxide reductase heme-binding subunit YedZ
MGLTYRAGGWNRQKKRYDLMIFGFCVVYLSVFVLLTIWFNPEYTFETLLIRSSSTLALLLLHIILAIGPLTRLSTRFLPLLYNRRHLGVTLFLVAALHSGFSLFQFHALGNLNPLVSLLSSNTRFGSVPDFPFQALGFLALVILLLLAATSHDFWLHTLGPQVWKSLHLFVYPAYFLVFLHVLLGVIQYETQPVFIWILGLGSFSLVALHLMAGIREYRKDHEKKELSSEGFIRVCAEKEIMESRAKICLVGAERIAVFRMQDRLFALHNVCKHQLGPLGEGRIVDGCVVCPWHGYQYYPHNGQSPPPFREKVKTYDLKIEDGQVWLNPNPHPEGTERPGVSVSHPEN